MFRHSTRRLQLGTALLLALIIAGCSSSDEGGGAPAAVADTGSGGDEATGEFVLKQTFDMGIEVTSPVFNRIRRIRIHTIAFGDRSPLLESLARQSGGVFRSY